MESDFELIDEKFFLEIDGREEQFTVLFSFTSPVTNKGYIGFTDDEVNNGKKNIYIKSYNPIYGIVNLSDVTSKKELDIVNNFVTNLEKECG